MKLEKTITSIFMIPTLNVPKNKLKLNGFINGYIDDADKEDKYQDCVYLLFLPENLEKFKDFLDSEYERTKSIIEDYNYQNDYVVVIYKLSTKYKPDFELVKQGLYSKTSKEFQSLFAKTVDIVNENNMITVHKSLQHQIFDRDKSLVNYWENKLNVNLKNIFGDNFELWETWEEEEEVLNINSIIETKNEKSRDL